MASRACCVSRPFTAAPLQPGRRVRLGLGRPASHPAAAPIQQQRQQAEETSRRPLLVCAAAGPDSGEQAQGAATTTSAPPPPPAAAPSAAAQQEANKPLILQKGQGTAIVTGAISIIFGVAYLALVVLMDWRGGEMLPPPPEAYGP